MVAGFTSAAIQAAVGAVLGFAAGGTIGLLIGLAIGLVLGAVFGHAIAVAKVYDASPMGVWLFIVDHSWSLLNTVAGSLFLTVLLISGRKLDRTLSLHSGRVNVVQGVSSLYATTIGTVTAGVTPNISRHEDLHILQSRAFGAAYIPLVLANYALFTVAPVWLLYHDHAALPITGPIKYFQCGVYPHVWNEAWAYRIQGTPVP